MDEDDVFCFAKELGCCDGCCLRYLGIKNPNAYEKTKEYVRKFHKQSETENRSGTSEDASKPPAKDRPESPLESPPAINGASVAETCEQTEESSENGCGTSAPVKRRKWAVCVSCLGVLQEETWPLCIEHVTDVLQKKRYECGTFACALSAPMATMLREKAVTLLLAERFPDYDARRVTPLKEAWKWSFGSHLATQIGKILDSGAVSPLLITVNMDYPDETEELLPLKQLAPQLFRARAQQARRFAVDMTRRAVEQALEGATLSTWRRVWPRALPERHAPACSAGAAAQHAPLCLGGRYVKLSRSLPQTPWLLQGRRVMDSSVQELIFGPIARTLGVEASECEQRLKFVAAGREDVDVRCLGTGRPFAVEISDPRREPSASELQAICDSINADARVTVSRLFVVSKEDLSRLKLGEETKCKTYEALCVKLTHTDDDLRSGRGDLPPVVTAADIRRLNEYCPGAAGAAGAAGVPLWQRTPLRVLHRRPLLRRARRLHALHAARVRGHPGLFTLRVTTAAGTYVKEWAHGELRRCRPALRHALGARADLLLLDVRAVHLDWPGSG